MNSNTKNNAETEVYVAVSGGVDSSVSAALLKEAGYDVTGVFMRVWEPPFLDCDWKKERNDAMRVCAQLGIDFKEFDLSDAYKNEVVDYMIHEYAAGRTPNPDVMCNKRIKFGAFFKQAMDDGADLIATGHYARKKSISQSNKNDHHYQLQRGVDETKDQTYFLWTLSQKHLRRTIFPVGEFAKSKVRQVAKERGLFTHQKDDSQGLCFLGHVDMEEFLEKFVETETGDILNENGEKIGEHDGAVFYTIGQRRGFDVHKKAPDSGPWYVVDKDMKENTITVSEDNTKSGPLYNAKTITITNTNWIDDLPDEKGAYQAQIRYNQTPQECTLVKKEGNIKIIFDEHQRGVAAGQSLVLYDEDVCLGGGIIENTETQ